MVNARTENNAQVRLLAEAHQISYRLRSTFFYRKMKEYDVLSFPSMIARLSTIEGLYNWDQSRYFVIPSCCENILLC